MNKESTNRKENESIRDQKILAKNTYYSFLGSYSTYFLALVTSFLLARMITPSSWGYLIVATSYITIITYILSFLPPGLEAAMNYYIPRYKTLNEKNKLKSFILKGLYIKMFIVIICFISSLIIFNTLSYIFTISLNGYIHLLNLLSPLIIITNLDTIVKSIHVGFGRFKTTYFLSIIKFIVNVSLLVIAFIFIEDVTIELIAIINVITLLIPFIVSCIIFIYKFLEIENSKEEGLKFKEFFPDIIRYGGLVSTQIVFSNIWGEVKKITVGIFATEEIVTGYNISNRYSEVISLSIRAFSQPLLISFTSLHSKNEYNTIPKIYKIYYKYSFFLISLITGILWFFGDFFLFFIYGEPYLTYSLILKLFIISIIFNPIGSLFFVGLKSINKVKLVPIIDLFLNVLRIAFFLTGLIFFGIYGALIGLIICRFIIYMLMFFFSSRFLSIRLNVIRSILQFIAFFGSLFVAMILGDLFLNEIYYNILSYLNLTFFRYLNLFTLGIFIVLFFVLNFILSIITKSDIEIIEKFIPKDKMHFKILRKLLEKLKLVAR